MVAALDIREPARDLIVIPGAEKIVMFHAEGRVHEGLLSCRRGSGQGRLWADMLEIVNDGTGSRQL